MHHTKKYTALWLILALILIILPAQAQDGGAGNPANIDRVTYFATALRPDFQRDIAAFLDAPLYILNADLTLDADKAVIVGQLAVEYTNLSPDTLNEVVFRLYPNLDSFGGETLVSAIDIEGIAITPTFDSTGSVMIVALPSPLVPAGTLRLGLTFQTTVYANVEVLYAQFSYLNGALALPDFMPMLSVYESGNGWWQNISHPQGDAVYSETAFFDVTLTAPAELTLIASGSLTTIQRHDDNTRTFHFIAPLMRDFALMAHHRYQTLTDTQDDITIDVHYLPGGERGAFLVLRYAKDAVRIYSELFGPYPYVELDIVETYTTAGGIEYPGLVVVQDDAWQALDLYLEIVTAHEVAHQWWYALVGNDQTRYPWLDESLAQYTTALYFGNVYGRNAQQSVFNQYETEWRSYANSQGDLPVGLPVTSYMGTEAYFRIVYEKGPMFFATLAEIFGEEILLAALSDYFATYRYRIATPADLQTSLEQSLGQDLDALFAEWVGS